MRILITAANGYVGSSLVKQLSPDYDVVGISRRDCDLTDPNSVARSFKDCDGEPFDFLIHCAVTGGSLGRVDDAAVTHNNLLMFNNLMFWKGRAFKAIINIGSGAEYDRRYRVHPYSRATNRGVPVDPYGMSKFYIDRYIQSEPDAYNLRVFAVFNENELDRRFIKTALRNYIADEPVRLAGGGDLEMDFIYMDDFVYLLRQVLVGKVPPNVKSFDCVYQDYGFPEDSRYSKTMRDIVLFHIDCLEPGKHVQVVDAPDLTPGFTESYLGTPPQWVDHRELLGLGEGIRQTFEKLRRQHAP